LGFFVKGQPVEVLLFDNESRVSAEERESVIEAIEEQYELLADSRSKIEARLRRQGLPLIVVTDHVVGGIPASAKERFREINRRLEKYDRTWAYYSPATSGTRVGVPYLKTTSPLPYSLHMLQQAKPVLLVRGDVDSPGPEVDVGWPAIFGTGSKTAIEKKPRTALVDWLVDKANPLTARVWVNRIWLYHFGRGLVETPDDFGLQGKEPTHSELLDWLAAELIESGWDTAHIQRLILESNTYRQSSQYIEAYAQADPENHLYWRWQPRRLEAEAIRDSLLSVSGLLDASVGGPSVPLKERNQSVRRTIYLEQKRGELPYVQQLFDAPSTLSCCGRRRNSTVALQPLYLLNDPRVYEYAEALAARLGGNPIADQKARIERAFHLTLGRSPTESEMQAAIDFLQVETPDESQESEDLEDAQGKRWIHFCHAIMNLNEFTFIP
jgi:hypothetical protein